MTGPQTYDHDIVTIVKGLKCFSSVLSGNKTASILEFCRSNFPLISATGISQQGRRQKMRMGVAETSGRGENEYSISTCSTV